MRLLPLLIGLVSFAADPEWYRISSLGGNLPSPAGSHEQTGLLLFNADQDRAQDLVISFRVKGPALVLYRHQGGSWVREVIEPEFLPLEAGGAAYDIDRDGDLDIVFGGDGTGSDLWWWENPAPAFGQGPWKRHLIKQGGARQHHDQLFVDLLGTGTPQLVFWNQKAKTLFLTQIPNNPKDPQSWKLETIFSGNAGEAIESAARYAEGLDAADIDGDGRLDLLAGNSWFRRHDGKLEAIQVGAIGGRIRAGHFGRGKIPQIVIAPGDGIGPLKIYECQGRPELSSCWRGRDLLGRDMVHGHTLELADLNGDGHLDIFAAEMAKWSQRPVLADHPGATAWILYGNGKGTFRKTLLSEGFGWHEGKIGDIDGDGDLDIVNKPYTWLTPRLDLWIQLPGQP